jgi:ATP-dependent Clp protease, protease subunit
MADLAGSKIAYLGYCGLIDSAGVTRIAQNINAAVNQQFDSVYLCLTSLGGYVGDGVFLFNHIRGLPIPVTIHNTGTVASIATTLFVAGEPRFCSQKAIFMMHPVAMGLQSQALASAPLLAALEAAKADEERTETILRERTKMPADILTARRQGDVFIAAKQALDHGLVHEIREFALPPGNQVFQI